MKYALMPVAAVVGLASWIGLIYAFKHSRVAVLESLTFWISHFAFTGWLLALLLIVSWWKILTIVIAHFFGSPPGGST